MCGARAGLRLTAALNIRVRACRQFKESDRAGKPMADRVRGWRRARGVICESAAELRDTGRYVRCAPLRLSRGVPGHQPAGCDSAADRRATSARFCQFSAYDEGWAVMTERLGWDMGSRADQLDNLGRLRSEMFRAGRMGVETGDSSQKLDARPGDCLHAGKTGMAQGERRQRDRTVLVRPDRRGLQDRHS